MSKLAECFACEAVRWRFEQDARGPYLVCEQCGHRTSCPAWYLRDRAKKAWIAGKRGEP